MTYALIPDNLDKSQSLLERVDPTATEVGLHINSNKTEYMQLAYSTTTGRPYYPRQFKTETGGRLPVPRRLVRANEGRP